MRKQAIFVVDNATQNICILAGISPGSAPFAKTYIKTEILMCGQYKMGCDVRNPVFGGLGTTKTQTSLRTRISAFVIRFLESITSRLAAGVI